MNSKNHKGAIVDSRIDVVLSGNMLEKAARAAGLPDVMTRAAIVRYFVALRAGYEHEQAIALATETKRGPKSVTPPNNRIAAPISSDLLEAARNQMPAGTSDSIMFRSMLVEFLTEVPTENAIELATMPVGRPKGAKNRTPRIAGVMA